MSDASYWDHIEQAYDAVSIYDGPEVFAEGFQQLPGWVGDLLAAHWLLSEVSNGGFTQFFLNSTGVLAPEAAAAFRHMGLLPVASVVERAIATFGPEYPRTEDVRSAHLAALSGHDPTSDAWDPFEADTFKNIEAELYQLGDPNLGEIYDTMDAYARTNVAS